MAARVPFGVLVAALVLEIALRAFGPFLPGTYRTGPLIEPDPEIGWRHVPSSTTWFRTPEFVARVETDANGHLIGGHHERPGVAKTVVLFGDSFVGATQLPYDRTMAGILSDDARLRDTLIVNDGVSGYGTDQEVLLLERRTARSDVAVLVFTVANDVWNNEPALERRRPTFSKPHFELEAERLRLIPITASSVGPLERVRPLLARSWLLTTIKTGVIDPLLTARRDRELRRELLDVLRPPPSAEWQRGWRVTEALIARFAESARARGAIPLLVIAPDACQVHHDLCAGQVELYESRLPQDRLARVASAAQIQVVDLLPAFKARSAISGERLYFTMDLHWNEQGQRTAAEQVARALTSLSQR